MVSTLGYPKCPILDGDIEIGYLILISCLVERYHLSMLPSEYSIRLNFVFVRAMVSEKGLAYLGIRFGLFPWAWFWLMWMSQTCLLKLLAS